MAATNVFNEKETGYITLTFTDEDDNAVTPDSATYTLYNEADNAIINSREGTTISPLAASVDIELTPSDNVIVDTALDNNVYEIHVLMIEWVYNTDKQGKDEHRFNVKNLTKVS
jgi:hypothetical protein